VFIALGVAIAFFVQFLPSYIIRIGGYVLLLLSIVLLYSLLIPGNPFAVTLNGATRWVRIAGFTVQPSELAKLSLIIVVADLLSRIKLHIRLMESERVNLYGESGRKGVSDATVNLILQALSGAPEGMTVQDIAHSTGLATQTAYRYLQHLAGDKRVLAENVYGKVGRPKMVFRIETEGKA